ELPQQKIVQNGNYISIIGLAKAQTTYKVTVSGGVLDEFGQTLGKDETLTFPIGDPNPTFFGPDGMVVLDPAAKKPTLDFFTTNYEHLKVQLYSVEPSDFDGYLFFLRNQWNHDHKPRMPGKKAFDQLVATTKGHNELVETSLDLMPALHRSGLGQAIAVVEPYPWTNSWEPPRLYAWVQSTKLAVDAHVDNDTLVAFATDLG